MKFLPKLCASLAIFVAVVAGHASNAADQYIPAPAAFCIDHPAACGPCPNCTKGQIDITIRNPAGEKACAANGGTIILNASGNKVCGGHYMRMQSPAPTNSSPLPH